MSQVLPLQRWVREHKRDLGRMGIKPVQCRYGAFNFEFGYSGRAPYFGRRWDGMVSSITIVPLPDGTFTALGYRVVGNKVPYTFATTGTLNGDFAALLAGSRLVELLARLKLQGGGSDSGGPTLPDPGQTINLDEAWKH